MSFLLKFGPVSGQVIACRDEIVFNKWRSAAEATSYVCLVTWRWRGEPAAPTHVDYMSFVIPKR